MAWRQDVLLVVYRCAYRVYVRVCVALWPVILEPLGM